MAIQLPSAAWFAISARSAAPQPARSSAVACLRQQRGKDETLLMAKAQAVPLPNLGLSLRARSVRSALGPRERSGYAPRDRRKGAGRLVV
eukprot:4011093-Pleurochrysis_carterae.AAC.3